MNVRAQIRQILPPRLRLRPRDAAYRVGEGLRRVADVLAPRDPDAVPNGMQPGILPSGSTGASSPPAWSGAEDGPFPPAVGTGMLGGAIGEVLDGSAEPRVAATGDAGSDGAARSQEAAPVPAAPDTASVAGASHPAPSPTEQGTPAATSADRWFTDHVDAARQVLDFLGGDLIDLEGRRVADIGCGDGIIDLALAIEGGPEVLVGYDLNLTDTNVLLERARSNGYCDVLPLNLRFEASGPVHVPAQSQSFDVVVSWSCFEHVSDAIAMAREIRRILKDDGVAFVQLWPFYFSAHGAHLEEWYPEGFAHLVLDREALRAGVRQRPGQPSGWADFKWDEFGKLNQITMDQLHGALRVGGLRLVKANLYSETARIPPELADLPPSRGLVTGFKALLVPDGSPITGEATDGASSP